MVKVKQHHREEEGEFDEEEGE
eukprot:gene11993-biopygen5036